MKRKIAIVFGTRPEITKLAPLVLAMLKSKYLEPILIATGQHRDFTESMLAHFDLNTHYNLDVMTPGQEPLDVVSKVLGKEMRQILKTENPAMLIVQGDTMTAMAAAMVGAYSKIPVGHVEAGLRTWNKEEPFPEELNRTIISKTADYHFAPTICARRNLLKEDINSDTVFVTGNTQIDSVRLILEKNIVRAKPRYREILVTTHRRENIPYLTQICSAIRRIRDLADDIKITLPVHPNPAVEKVVLSKLNNEARIDLVKPMAYPQFINKLNECYLIISDSGGIQEEASYLQKPLLIMRNVTERPEVVEAGVAKLVGNQQDNIVTAAKELLYNQNLYNSMTGKQSLFGSGYASEKIVTLIEEILRNNST